MRCRDTRASAAARAALGQRTGVRAGERDHRAVRRIRHTVHCIHFAFTSAEPDEDAHAVLDKIALVMHTDADWKLRVVGHTGSEGPHGHDNPALPFLATGFEPPSAHDFHAARVRMAQALGMALEPYDYRLPIAREVERDHSDLALAYAPRRHREADSLPCGKRKQRATALRTTVSPDW